VVILTHWLIHWPSHAIAALLLTTWQTLRRWMFHLGGVGLIPLALLDNSPIPTPGAMDIAVILLSARQPTLWLYYAAMATAGSVLGGFLTYRIARKAGKVGLEHKFSRKKVDQVCAIFERWGFASIVFPAIAPPPFPFVLFVLAAGAMQYPAKKFLAALALGRAARYAILAYLGERYGRHIISLIRREFGHPVIMAIIITSLVAIAAAYYFLLGRKSKKWTWKFGG
jgi:membrane protein YqaA with SNARE-associated domain